MGETWLKMRETVMMIKRMYSKGEDTLTISDGRSAIRESENTPCGWKLLTQGNSAMA